MKENNIKKSNMYDYKIFVDSDKNVIIERRPYKLVCSKSYDGNFLVRKVYVDDMSKLGRRKIM